jgi:2-hydroxy-3-keto-5-methylthiopentenyl-1-phosphate phosphatase
VDSKRKTDYKKRKLVEEVVEKVYLISRGQGFTTQVRKLVEKVVEMVYLISRGQGFTTQVRKLLENAVGKGRIRNFFP